MRTLSRSGLPFLTIILLSAGSLAAPGGLYSSAPPAPAPSSSAPAPRDLEHAVSSDGEARYTIPFAVPPGRAGAQPEVQLVYGSRSPLRGGIAAGWTLPIPTISVDTSNGRMRGLSYQVDGKPLIMVNEPANPAGAIAYRADGDTDYVRYEHVSDGSEAGHWRARHLDGSVAVYGATPGSRDQRTEGSAQSGTYGGQGRWFLSSLTDARGNVIDYTYEVVTGNARNGSVTNTPVDVALRRIEYGRNERDKFSEHHARIELAWQSSLGTCAGSHVPIGAQFSYATGIRRYEGARKLLAIASYVKESPGGPFEKRRELSLGYDAQAESCNAGHAPLRRLASVQERAWTRFDPPTTPSVVLPAQTFTYGPWQHSYQPVHDDWVDTVSSGKNPLAHDKPGGWPSRDTMFMDIDGSGAPSVLQGSLCEELPKMPYANGTVDQPAPYGSPDYLASWEGCSLAAQVTHRSTPRDEPSTPWIPNDYQCGQPANFYGYHFLDVNGDGRPDLIGAIDYQKGGYRPAEDPAIAADYPACSSLPTPPCRTDDGTPVACFFAPDNQRVWPMDASYGPNGNAMLVQPGGGAGGLGGAGGKGNIGVGASGGFLDPGVGGGGGAGGVFLQPTGSSGITGVGGGPLDPVGTGVGAGGGAGTGGTAGQCPSGCVRWDSCSGSAEECCSDEFCEETGSPLDPPTPDAFEDAFRGNPGGRSYETQGMPPGPVYPHCGHVPDLHCGWYVYRVHLNVSDGNDGPVFDPTPHVVRSPVPIDGMEMTSAGGLGPMGNASAWRAIVDIDGDDRPDALYQKPNYMGGVADIAPQDLQVWLGSQSGVDPYLGSGGDNTALWWSMPESSEGMREMLDATDDSSDYRTTGFNGLSRSFRTQLERVSMHDINGDGLLDLVRRQKDSFGKKTQIKVFYNTGSGFETVGTVLSTSLPAMSRRLRWLAKAANGIPVEEIELSIMSARPADLDGDGLIDVVKLPEPGANGEGHLWPFAPLSGAITAYFSTGDRFLTYDATAQLGPWRAALSQVNVSEQSHYRALSDYVDDDGDGLPDMLMPTNIGACSPPVDAYSLYLCGLMMNVHHAAREPLHVLREVHNGLGAKVEFDYASMRDEDVVARDEAHQRTSPLWLVSSVAVGLGNAAAVTHYHYQNPVHGEDRAGRFGFRGFETVVETGPAVASGARAREYSVFRYDLDPEGLPDRSLSAEVLANGDERLETVTENAWFQTPLFDSRLQVFQDAGSIVSTCGNPVAGLAPAQEAGCIADPETGVNRSAKSWTVQGSQFYPSVWAVTEKRRLPTRVDSTADVRRDVTTFEMRYGAGKYQLLSTDIASFDDQQVQLARVHNLFDALGNVLQASEWVDDNTVATTVRSFDIRSNPVTVMQPKHFAFGSGLMQVLVYDAFGLYPQQIVNEIGHTTYNTTDIASGTVVYTRGVETNGASWVTMNELDALGRVRIHSQGADYGAYDTIRKTQLIDYVDTGARSVTTATLLQEPVEVWKQDTLRFDALGRIYQEEQHSANGPRVIDRTYDPAGRVLATTVPGAVGNGPQVFSYVYDGFGRVVEAVAPLSAPVQTTYFGLRTTISQASTDGTPSTQKVLVHDGFGRLTSVREGALTPAVTNYEYDEGDRVRTLTDADGLQTTLEYDHRGLRTSIGRGNTLISYEYDLHGNRVAMQHPTGADPFDPQLDVSYWKYDEVDRISEAHPARRRLTDDELSRFGSGQTIDSATFYTYDDPGHAFGVGRLTTVETPALTVDFAYGPAGEVEEERRTFHIAPKGVQWSGQATQKLTHDVGGRIVSIDFPEADHTGAIYAYDDRGRPLSVVAYSPLLPPGAWASVEYDVAGFVAARQTPFTGVGQAWTRDAAGRVATTEVQGGWGCQPGMAGCASTIIAGEALTFDSLGRVQSSSELGQALSMTFGYDQRSQLISASGGATYQAGFAYTPGGRVEAASVGSNLPGAEVIARNVEHDYTPHDITDHADPAAVRALRDVASDEEIATLVYDPSGNLTEKASPNGNWSFVYDGEDRLRQVSGSKGEVEIYYYDHTGERVLTYRNAGGEEVVRHRLGGAELFQKDYATGPSTYTVDVSLGNAPVMRVEGGYGEASADHLFHGAVGSLLAVVDGKGRGTARFGYGPFGEVLYADGPAAEAFDRLFNDKPRDEVSTLRYYGARYYDPLTLSWTQADPLYRFAPDMALEEPLRQALYAFSLNDPLRYVDLDGRDSRPINSKERVAVCTATNQKCTKKKRIKGTSVSVSVSKPGSEADAQPGQEPRQSSVTLETPNKMKRRYYEVYIVDEKGDYVPGTHGQWNPDDPAGQEYPVDYWVAKKGGDKLRAVIVESASVSDFQPSARREIPVWSVDPSSDNAEPVVRTDLGTEERVHTSGELVIFEKRTRTEQRFTVKPVPVTRAHGRTPGTSDWMVTGGGKSGLKDAVRQALRSGNSTVKVHLMGQLD